MEELFKFKDLFRAVLKAHENGSIEAERSAGIEGLELLENNYTPSFDPETGKAVNERTFEDAVNNNRTAGEYAFIKDVQRHAQVYISEADKFLTQSNENTPQGKFISRCKDIAEAIADEAEEYRQFYIVEASGSTTPEIEPCIAKRTSILYESSIDKIAKAKLYKDLVDCGVFSGKEPQSVSTFCAFIFGDDLISNNGYLFVENKDKLTAAIKSITERATLCGIKVREGCWENVQSWVRTITGEEFKSKNSLRQCKNKYPEIKKAVNDVFSVKKK